MSGVTLSEHSESKGPYCTVPLVIGVLRLRAPKTGARSA